jgi:hypothetical protein
MRRTFYLPIRRVTLNTRYSQFFLPLAVLLALALFLGKMPGTALANHRSGGSGTCWKSGAAWSPHTADYWTGDPTIPSAWRSTIDVSAQTWTNVASSSFVFIGRSYAPPNGNNIRYASDSRDFEAVTDIYASTTTISKVITTLNSRYPFTIGGIGDSFDVQNILTHEFGHWLNLYDMYSSSCSSVTMYGYGAYGQTFKRTLDTPDINGISWQYP